jgi:hypothetical protein
MIKRLLGIALLVALGVFVRRRLAELDAPPHAPELSSPVTALPATPAAPIAPPAPVVTAPPTAVEPVAAAEAPEAPAVAPPAEEAPAPADAELAGLEGYCMRCKERRPFADVHEETTENGRRAARGVCPVCGANMFKFLPARGEDS